MNKSIPDTRCFLVTGLYKRGKKQLFKLARRYVPSIRKKVREQCTAITQNFEKDFLNRVGEIPFLVHLPETGLDDKIILDIIKSHVELGKIKDNVFIFEYCVPIESNCLFYVLR